MEITVDDATPISAVVAADTPVAEVAAQLNNETSTDDDEDYKWLTERLDAATLEIQQTRQAMLEAITATREQANNQSSELREANRILTELVQTLITQMTDQFALLKLIPQTSPITLVEATPIATPEVNPESVVVESPAVELVPVRKRRML